MVKKLLPILSMVAGYEWAQFGRLELINPPVVFGDDDTTTSTTTTTAGKGVRGLGPYY